MLRAGATLEASGIHASHSVIRLSFRSKYNVYITLWTLNEHVTCYLLPSLYAAAFVRRTTSSTIFLFPKFLLIMHKTRGVHVLDRH